MTIKEIFDQYSQYDLNYVMLKCLADNKVIITDLPTIKALYSYGSRNIIPTEERNEVLAKIKDIKISDWASLWRCYKAIFYQTRKVKAVFAKNNDMENKELTTYRNACYLCRIGIFDILKREHGAWDITYDKNRNIELIC